MIFISGLFVAIIIASCCESWKPVLIASAIVGAIGGLLGVGLAFMAADVEFKPAPDANVIVLTFLLTIPLFMAKAAACYGIKLGIRQLRRTPAAN
jgi:hypothetical protein